MSFMRGVLIFSLAVGASAQAETTASFQLANPVSTESQVFFVGNNQMVFRFPTVIGLEDLKSQTSGANAPISSLEVLAHSSGKILKFAVFRFSNVEVYEVRKVDETLKFVKLEGASALFTGPMSSYRASTIRSSEAIQFLKVSSEQEFHSDNLRILRLIRLDSAEENLASKGESGDISKQEFLNLLDQDVKKMDPPSKEQTGPVPLVGGAPTLN